jgi:hypothetical protein
MPISSEPAPSYRPWTFTAGATLLRTAIPYHDTFRRLGKTGTFYFAQNRNFLLCVDTGESGDRHDRTSSHVIGKAILVANTRESEGPQLA